MYAIEEHTRTLPDGKTLTTYSREIVSCNMLLVEAGTTGFMGGDSGHGGRTYFRIEDEASTDIRVQTIENRGEGGFEVILGGDCELDTIITALEFITQVLKEERGGLKSHEW